MDSTLVITPAPTLMEALPELASIADVYCTARRLGEGVEVARDSDGVLVSVGNDDRIPVGVFRYMTSAPVRPWDYFAWRDCVLTGDGEVHWL